MMRAAIFLSGVTACFVLCCLNAAAADLPSTETIQSAAAKDAIFEYEKAKNDLDAIYRGVVRDLNSKLRSALQANRTALLDALETARKEAAKNDELDQALLLRDSAEHVAALPIDVPGSEAEAHSAAKRAKNRRAAARIDLATLTTAQLEEKLVGKWKANDGSEWEIEAGGKIKSNHRVKLFQSCEFYVRVQNDEIYLGVMHPGQRSALFKLDDLDTLTLVDARPALIVRRTDD